MKTSLATERPAVHGLFHQRWKLALSHLEVPTDDGVVEAEAHGYGGPGEMGMGMRMRMRIRMRMRACIAQTCTLLSESALPFHMLRTYPYDAGVLAFGLAFVFVFVLSRIMRVFGLA